MFKVGYSQYPIQQFIGADSAVVTSKGGMQGRFINVVFPDTTTANSQRIRQYAGAMIYAAGKMWVRNTTATGWTELAYGPISTTNIYNSNGTLTGNRDLDGGGYNLTFSSIGGEFGVGADSINFAPASGKFRISSLNQGIGTRALRYNPVTKLITYSDTTSSVNIYNSDGTLTGNRELDADGNNLTFTAVRKFSLSGDSLDYTLDPAGNLRIGLGNQQFIMRSDTASLSRRISYTGNLGSSFTKHSLVDKNYVDSIGVLSPTGSGTTNYVPKWTGSTALGNSLIFDNSTQGRVGINTASPASTLELYKSTGTNYLYVTNGTSGTLNGVVLRWNAVDYMGMIGNFNSGEFKVGGFNAGGYFMTFYSNNAERMRLTPSGRLLLGTTTESTYLLDVNGTTRISGTELRLDNGTTGVINLFSNTPEIRFASADPTNYRFYRSGTTMYWNSAGNIRLQIAGNEAYQIDAANGHILRSAISGGAALARLTTGGNFMVGTTTDAGYKLDVNGTARVQGGSAVASVIENSGTNAGLRITNSTYPYIVFNRAGTVAKSFGIFNASGDMAIQESTGWSGANSHIFYGGGGFSTIGSGTFGNNVAANASAVLEATSTTKGFLPPRMTTTQKNAISSPAAGLVVYDTTLNKLCVYTTAWETVTSL
jgi:hypothetical protein